MNKLTYFNTNTETIRNIREYHVEDYDPCVYGIWSDGKLLYIGMTTNNIIYALKRVKARSIWGDEIEKNKVDLRFDILRLCESVDHISDLKIELLSVKQYLIRHFCPRNNVHYNIP
jgi:hypothetical protein